MLNEFGKRSKTTNLERRAFANHLRPLWAAKVAAYRSEDLTAIAEAEACYAAALSTGKCGFVSHTNQRNYVCWRPILHEGEHYFELMEVVGPKRM